MTFKYEVRRAHAWWKFWVFGKWIVYRVNQPSYILRGFNKVRAAQFAHVANRLGSRPQTSKQTPRSIAHLGAVSA